MKLKYNMCVFFFLLNGYLIFEFCLSFSFNFHMWEGICDVPSLSLGGGRDDITTEKLKKMSFKIVVGGKLR